MADDTPLPPLIDPGTAEVYANQMVTQQKALVHLASVLRTANEARHWMESSKQEIAALQKDLAGLKAEKAKAVEDAKTAKRLQVASEENARIAAAEAKAAEDQAGARIRAAQDNQAARLKELEDALEGRRRMLESDYAARLADLDKQIAAREAALAKAEKDIAAVKGRL